MKQDKTHDNAIGVSALSLWQILSYGSVMLPLSIGFSIFIMFIPTYYGVDLRIGLGIVGLIFAISRIFDFVTDPLIGFLSDSSLGILGNRKTWVSAGAIMFCGAVFLLFKAPGGKSPVFLFGTTCLYFLAFTLCEIPLAALGLEISKDTHERTRLALSKALFFILGGMMGAAIPLIWDASLEAAFSIAVTMIVIATLIILPIFCFFAPNSREYISHGPSLFRAFPSLLANANIRRIVLLFFIVMVAASLSGSLSLLYSSYILERPDQLGLFWLAAGLGLLCGLPLWYVMSRKIGKIQTWRFAILLSVGCGMPLLFLGVGDSEIMIGVSFLLGICGACDTLIPVSLLADHVGESQERGEFGAAGSITALKNAASKLSVIGPMLLAFPLLGLLGISRETESIIEQSSNIGLIESTTLVGLYAGLPLALRFLAYVLMPRLWPEIYKY